tara:strand:+ start:10764 stop:11456 length:693 start_codon:yes stop_codon:yes gene_type:complete
LSILRQQDGLSFLVKNTKSKQLYMIGFVPAGELEEDPFKELLASFSEQPGTVIKAQEFGQSVLLPKALGTKDKKWTKVLLGSEADRVFFSESLAVEVYALTHKASKELKHNWLIQMERLPKASSPRLWVNLESTTATYFAADTKGYQLVNTLPTSSNEELLYHLGNISEQLGWDRETLLVEVCGLNHQKAIAFVKPYFKAVKSIKANKYVKLSSALNKVDIESYGPLLRL